MSNIKLKINTQNRNIVQDSTPLTNLSNCTTEICPMDGLCLTKNIQNKHKLWYTKLWQQMLYWYVQNNIQDKIHKP